MSWVDKRKADTCRVGNLASNKSFFFHLISAGWPSVLVTARSLECVHSLGGWISSSISRCTCPLPFGHHENPSGGDGQLPSAGRNISGKIFCFHRTIARDTLCAINCSIPLGGIAVGTDRAIDAMSAKEATIQTSPCLYPPRTDDRRFKSIDTHVLVRRISKKRLQIPKRVARDPYAASILTAWLNLKHKIRRKRPCSRSLQS